MYFVNEKLQKWKFIFNILCQGNEAPLNDSNRKYVRHVKQQQLTTQKVLF